MEKKIIKIVFLIIACIFYSNANIAGVAVAADCASFASLTVTTDKTTYVGGETISGSIVFTNNAGASAYIDYTGNMYENDVLIFTKSGQTRIPVGVSTFALSDLFAFLDVYIGTRGGIYRFEVSVTPWASEAAGCVWSSAAVVTVPPPQVPVTQLVFPALAGFNIGAPHNYDELPYLEQIAKRDVVVLGLYNGWNRGGRTPADVVRALKSLNPNIYIGAYTNMTEMSDTELSDLPYRDKLYSESGPVGIGDWWAYDSNGARIDWNNGDWGTHDVNITSFVTPDANGDRWPQWIAKKNYELVLSGNNFDFWFVDNNFFIPRSDADWNRDGVTDDRNDPIVQGWWRAGQRAYYDQAAIIAPNLYLMINADSDLSGEVYPIDAQPFDEYKNVVHGAFLEHMMGVSWSVETWGGWDLTLRRYYKTFYNLLPPRVVIFEVFGAPTDYQFFRYAFATSLLNDGFFCYSGDINFQSYEPLPWFDEYDLAGTSTTKWLGKAVDIPPTLAWQNGVYRRRFENGMAIVNPKGNGRQTVTVEPGYIRISGTQDPIVNNGQIADTITLNERDGMVLLKAY